MNIDDAVKHIWNTNAAFWDGRMQEGNDFHKILIEPNQLEMLQIKKGDAVLDIACGNGQFARKMASLGAKVTAIDFSQEFLDIAKAKSPPDIKFELVDVTSQKDLEKLKRRRFESAVCTMALMDIAKIEPLINFLAGVLKPGGKFVFSIMHPCFNSADTTLVEEHSDAAGKPHRSFFVKIKNSYLVSRKFKGWGMREQPKAQYYFHRPLSEIFNLCFNNGFVLNAIREPSFTRKRTDSIWENVYRNIPAALICGLVLKK
jgi:2-polyprenyl-3-methyl-5-hydroxy-6-metoxy-1,4-benzoquinol methylase